MNGFEYIPHNFVKKKSMPWLCCRGCGLLTLNNQFTEWAIKKGCDNYYSPAYKATRAKYTELGG